MKPAIDFSQLKSISLKELAMRFLFGGLISVLAHLIANLTNARIGGIFTTFPAILIASLTIIGQHEGKQAAESDARGGVLGAIALVITTIALSLMLGMLTAWLTLLTALLLWLGCSIILYLLFSQSEWLRREKG